MSVYSRTKYNPRIRRVILDVVSWQQAIRAAATLNMDPEFLKIAVDIRPQFAKRLLPVPAYPGKELTASWAAFRVRRHLLAAIHAEGFRFHILLYRFRVEVGMNNISRLRSDRFADRPDRLDHSWNPHKV